ncbi:hypothetical protein, partial [Nocardioides psychrotolerans]|uniref:hypothetical protein n=1 Tax=Nocardioides psychrotolerans TaxID=1005945 RepID=UPI003137DBF2
MISALVVAFACAFRWQASMIWASREQKAAIHSVDGPAEVTAVELGVPAGVAARVTAGSLRAVLVRVNVHVIDGQVLTRSELAGWRGRLQWVRPPEPLDLQGDAGTDVVP